MRTETRAAPSGVADQLLRVGAGLLPIFVLFRWFGARLGSDRGQAGVVICAAVLAAVMAAERLLSSRDIVTAATAVGLGRPLVRGLLSRSPPAAHLDDFVCAAVTGAAVGLASGWAWLVPLFAQGGIAEETLFRGYLFGHLRETRPFWRAARLSLLPFVSVHLLLFLTLPWPVALAAVMLAAIPSLPFAHLFELGGTRSGRRRRCTPRFKRRWRSSSSTTAGRRRSRWRGWGRARSRRSPCSSSEAERLKLEPPFQPESVGRLTAGPPFTAPAILVQAGPCS